MAEYHRFQHPGASWFFTVNLAERHDNRLLTDRIDLLRMAFSHIKAMRPFEIDAVVILPEHLHCILTLPAGDSDFSTRWGLNNAYFSRHISKKERISKRREKRGERGLRQRRFSEHLIRVNPIIDSM
jgi:putative transposase